MWVLVVTKCRILLILVILGSSLWRDVVGDEHGGSLCLQVAMQTQQDAVGVAVKVQQRSDQSGQMTELIDLQEETSGQPSVWICFSPTQGF